MQRILFVCAAAAALATGVLAVETRFWTVNEQPDFEKGTLKNLSLRSDGRLMLAPAFRELYDSSVPYLWALASDSRGNLYAGGGGPSSSLARLIRVDGQGKGEVWAEVPGMEIHAAAIDRKNQVFVATSPDGKVYRIAAKNKHELFYDPKAKYIWGMEFNSKGDLFIATGDNGEVHRVTPEGAGSVFFRSEDTHARSLAIDGRDNVIVGTEPGGLILRISPNGEGFVLYQSGRREVTALAVAQDGSIYVAGVGSKPGSVSLQPSILPLSIPPLPTSSQSQPSRPQTSSAPAPVLPASAPAPAASAVTGGSEVYRIEKDNYARKIWSHAQDIVYAIAFDSEGRPVLGTGNKGNIYRIDSDVTSTLLINALPSQITAFARGAKGRLYAVSGNIGKVYQLGPEIESEGTFESEPFDTGSFSYFGRMRIAPRITPGTILVETRTGNLDRPQKNWSPWAPVDMVASARVASPSARFLQYRLTLKVPPEGKSPEAAEVELAYMARNVAPSIEQVQATPPNYRFQPPSVLSTASPQTISLPALGSKKRNGPTTTIDLTSSASQTMQYAKGNVGARWLASDENGDEMLFKVEIRGAGESEWKLLREKIKERHLSWDSTAYPDGDYQVRVTATDSPDNTPEQALSRELASDFFGIDNTPPALTGLTASRAGQKLTAKWKARDARSVISKAEYSLNGGDWIVVEPTTRVTDAPDHDYVLTVDNLPKGEATLAVRVSDEYDNQAVEKAVVK